MKTLNKLLIAGVLATAAASSFAQDLLGTPPHVIGLTTGSDRARAEVRAEARQPRQVTGYLVTGDSFTPNVQVYADSGERARPVVRAEAREAVRASHTPSFIGG